MKIQAAVAERPRGSLALQAVELDEPREDEVLVRIVAVGICHTDILLRDGRIPCPFPVVLGHEGAGVVEQVGARVTKLQPGDHVILTNLSCGRCPACTRDEPQHCLNVTRLNIGGARDDGSTTFCGDSAHIHGAIFRQSSFATYALAVERNTIKAPVDLPFEILAPLGCGVQTGAGAVLNTLRPEPNSDIAVFGAGGVGMSAIMAARVVGCGRIIAVDLNPSRLALALELGATHTIQADKEDPVAAIREICLGGISSCIEAVGNPKVLASAVNALRPGGICVLVGAAGAGAQVTLDMMTLFRGIQIRGHVMGGAPPNIFLPRLIELYRQGRFPIDRIIQTYPFAAINEALASSESGSAIKAVLLIDRPSN